MNIPLENLQFTVSLASIITFIFFVVKYSRVYQRNEDRMIKIESQYKDHTTRIQDLEKKSNATDLLFVEIKVKLSHIETLLAKKDK